MSSKKARRKQAFLERQKKREQREGREEYEQKVLREGSIGDMATLLGVRLN